MTKKHSRIVVGVIFGGRSAEHEVSLVSATSVINGLDRRKYRVVPIGISPDGKWLSTPDALRLLKSGNSLSRVPDRILTPDPRHHGLQQIGSGSGELRKLDVIFPVLHGKLGEDGTIQGLFELAGIPYVGAGVLGSSVGMDKIITKQLCEYAGIPVTPYLWFLSRDFSKGPSQTIELVERKLGYPCFVKPANSGSSVGISKAHSRKELRAAISLALKYDRKILVEQGIENAREIELSVLGNDEPIASVPGEIVASNEFYDYDAKYVDGKSVAHIPAKFPAHTVKSLQKFALSAFRAIDCSGMARVDFLVKKKSNTIFFNEINTIPGFTSISMYPKLWHVSGISFPRLLDKLIHLALERHRNASRLRTAYRPKSSWYRKS
ncbi:MAG TPA: D-alanine--D-alanine ligase family protein [Bacteroidota bacterium]|nr:D-alanine--D-alanine ligase family protein [Bacteroidota bacterium]